MLKNYQKDFLRQAVAVDALRFGSFELKSGRKSPYFFNAGAFYDGKSLAVMAHAYSFVIKALFAKGEKVDVLFGPAYKGIPLAAAVAMDLFTQGHKNVAWAFNRKEKKAHGEGGRIVGAPLKDKRVLILDDVLTAGTAVRESLALLKEEGAEVVGLVVALDRQEKGSEGDLSALQNLQQNEGIECHAVVNLEDLLAFVQDDARLQNYLADLQRYRKDYGVKRA